MFQMVNGSLNGSVATAESELILPLPSHRKEFFIDGFREVHHHITITILSLYFKITVQELLYERIQHIGSFKLGVV